MVIVIVASCLLSTRHSNRRNPLCNNTLRGRTVKMRRQQEEVPMGKGILLWLLGIPLPIIILLLLFWH